MTIGKKDTGPVALAYFNICILWGATNLFTKIGVGGIPPMQFAFLRFLLAGAVMTAVTLLRREKFSFTKNEWRQLITIGILMNLLTNSCIVLSNLLIDSSIVTVMMATTPIFVTVFELMTGKAKVRPMTALGLAGGFAGILIVVFSGGGAVRATGAGVVIILMGMLFWSMGTLYSKGKYIQGSIFSHTAVEALTASVLFILISRVTGCVPLSQIEPLSLVPVAYLGICDSVIGFVSFHYLIKVRPAAQVCTYAYVNPVVALVLGYLFLDEPLYPGKVLGMVIIIGSVVLIQRSGGERP